MKKDTKKKVRKFGVILFVIGLLIFLCPYFYKAYKHYSYKKDIAVFENEKLEQLNEIDAEIPYIELYEDMLNYNEELHSNGQKGLGDQLDFETPDFYLSDYGLEYEIFGYIEVPKLEITLPIYNGASDTNMGKGAVYLPYSSLPCGGENTNTVIAAHNSFKGVDMFRYLYTLEIDDDIYITNFWETRHYKIVETKIIYPDEISNIYIQEGKELLTLSTCYPYPTRLQRYLVYAEYIND